MAPSAPALNEPVNPLASVNNGNGYNNAPTGNQQDVFATIERLPKTVVPIGFVGVVVSYYGQVGRDLSGDSFRHG